MEALILAGGFAKRMGELGKNTPKALLPVAGRPVIEHILEKLESLSEVNGVFISTNKKFEEHFAGWKEKLPASARVQLVIEPATGEGQKLGSIGALQFFIEQKGIDEDLLVINGDNLFEFDLRKFLDFYSRKSVFTFGVYDTKSINEAMKMGVVLSDQDGRVMNFEEKPEKPKSTQVSTGIYLFPKDSLHRIKQYLDEGNSPDRLGDFLAWLMKKQPIYAFLFQERWFDIGTPDTYKKAEKAFANAEHGLKGEQSEDGR